MPRRRLIIAVSSLLLCVTTLAVACEETGKDGATGTPAVTQTPAIATDTPAPAGTATPAPDIRQQDLAAHPNLALYSSTSGGRVDPAGIQYADLTQDGVDDAVVPISSGGEGGNIALFILGWTGEGLTELLRVAPPAGRLAASVTDGRLQVDEPLFAPGDPMCCPSQLQRMIYGWNGTELVIESQEVVPAGA